MLLSHSQQQANDYIEMLQAKFPNIQWAFYLAPLGEPYDKQVMDWLWINHLHMDLVVAQANDACSMALWMCMQTPHKFVLEGSDSLMGSLVSLSHNNVWTDSTHLFEYIVANNLYKKSTQVED
jgi:hypothetical protein